MRKGGNEKYVVQNLLNVYLGIHLLFLLL